MRISKALLFKAARPARLAAAYPELPPCDFTPKDLNGRHGYLLTYSIFTSPFIVVIYTRVDHKISEVWIL